MRLKRTKTCGELRSADAGIETVLSGWVASSRDHGGIRFINLRDRYGVAQVVINESSPEHIRKAAARLRDEYCISVSGNVRLRPAEMVNKEQDTGQIEVVAADIEVLSTCDSLPFTISDTVEAREDLRQTFRYLDLRSGVMQRNMALRSAVSTEVRAAMIDQGFLEIETPTMVRSTPEGARDFIIPSRLSPGRFYALPQSPQIFKQLLMVSGLDRYFQIARCYRDEATRGDRQPEFTQIDIEASFVEQEDIFDSVETMMVRVFSQCLNQQLETPFPRITHDVAINRYGSENPDLRFDLPLTDFNSIAERTDFKVFRSVLADGGGIRALTVPADFGLSRSRIDVLEKQVKSQGAKGLAWTRVTGDSFDGGIARFLSGVDREAIEVLGATQGDVVLFVADKLKIACESLGEVRNSLGKTQNLKGHRFCWINDFPLFEWDEEGNRWDPSHHPFSMPNDEDLNRLESDPGSVRGQVYDLVIDGVELGSGSIRIHDRSLQERVFSLIGINQEEARRRFGFMLDAFRYGPPPHGGIAFGLDRLVMIMAGQPTIREVIAFPKNTAMASLMDGSPAAVDSEQLTQVGLQISAAQNDDESV
jgi:aspartyl-tRNA synthetase